MAGRYQVFGEVHVANRFLELRNGEGEPQRHAAAGRECHVSTPPASHPARSRIGALRIAEGVKRVKREQVAKGGGKDLASLGGARLASAAPRSCLSSLWVSTSRYTAPSSFCITCR